MDNQKWVVVCEKVNGMKFERKFNSTEALDNFRRSVGVGFTAYKSKSIRILSIKKVDVFSPNFGLVI